MPEDRYAYFQRKSDERTQEKATAAQALRDTAAAAAPTPEAPETRSFGFRNTGGAKGQQRLTWPRRMRLAPDWGTQPPMVARPPCGRKRLLSPRLGWTRDSKTSLSRSR